VIIHKGGISPVWLFVGAGAIVLAWFLLHVRARERSGKEPLLPVRLFRNRASNLGLVTQNVQWLTMQGSFFVISVFLQEVRGFSAIETGLALTPATIGILGSSALAARMARKRSQRTIICFGFAVTLVGMGLLLLLARATSNILLFVPGLLAMGIGVGAMLTASVNVVQSSFPEREQGEISGLSRSVSNLGSSFGTALAGSILVSQIARGNTAFLIALAFISSIGLIGLAAALLLPRDAGRPAEATA
jgi:predicted MFS family arabinose efflux permease